MRAILTQDEVDDALDKFDNKDSKSYTEEEKRKDRKALTQI
jgi:flagellar motor switch protein FliM